MSPPSSAHSGSPGPRDSPRCLDTSKGAYKNNDERTESQRSSKDKGLSKSFPLSGDPVDARHPRCSSGTKSENSSLQHTSSPEHLGTSSYGSGRDPTLDKYASTTLFGGTSVITQLQLLEALMDPESKAATKEVTHLFTFWRPRIANPGRKSSVLALTERQMDAMYALAGCADVMFLISRIGMEVRKAVEEIYGIDKYNFATWFKNRGRNPSKSMGTAAGQRSAVCSLDGTEDVTGGGPTSKRAKLNRGGSPEGEAPGIGSPSGVGAAGAPDLSAALLSLLSNLPGGQQQQQGGILGQLELLLLHQQQQARQLEQFSCPQLGAGQLQLPVQHAGLNLDAGDRVSTALSVLLPSAPLQSGGAAASMLPRQTQDQDFQQLQSQLPQQSYGLSFGHGGKVMSQTPDNLASQPRVTLQQQQQLTGQIMNLSNAVLPPGTAAPPGGFLGSSQWSLQQQHGSNAPLFFLPNHNNSMSVKLPDGYYQDYGLQQQQAGQQQQQQQQAAMVDPYAMYNNEAAGLMQGYRSAQGHTSAQLQLSGVARQQPLTYVILNPQEWPSLQLQQQQQPMLLQSYAQGGNFIFNSRISEA